MKYKGLELKEITTLQVFDPPKSMLVWDDNTQSPDIGIVYSVVRMISGPTQAIGSVCRWDHCAEIPEEPKPGRATSRELAKWLATGNGEWCMKNGTGRIGANTNYRYSEYEENKDVVDGILVRKWDDTEWHEPTDDYMDIDVRSRD